MSLKKQNKTQALERSGRCQVSFVTVENYHNIHRPNYKVLLHINQYLVNT